MSSIGAESPINNPVCPLVFANSTESERTQNYHILDSTNNSFQSFEFLKESCQDCDSIEMTEYYEIAEVELTPNKGN